MKCPLSAITVFSKGTVLAINSFSLQFFTVKITKENYSACMLKIPALNFKFSQIKYPTCHFKPAHFFLLQLWLY